jgi:hypothetical protein
VRAIDQGLHNFIGFAQVFLAANDFRAAQKHKAIGCHQSVSITGCGSACALATPGKRTSTM